MRLTSSKPIFLFLLCVMLAPLAHSWPTEGTAVYRSANSTSERCLVPAHLYKDNEDGYLDCNKYPQDQIFRFTEAIGGVKVVLKFQGDKVIGRWYSVNAGANSEESIREVVLGGVKFLKRFSYGGKVDEGPIVGVRKGKVIYAKASSEGHNPESGFVRIQIRNLNNFEIEWKQTQYLNQQVGYLPEKALLKITPDGTWFGIDESPPPTCPEPDGKSAAPTACSMSGSSK